MHYHHRHVGGPVGGGRARHTHHYHVGHGIFSTLKQFAMPLIKKYAPIVLNKVKDIALEQGKQALDKHKAGVPLKQVLKEAGASALKSGKTEAIAVAKNALVDAVTASSQPNPLKQTVAEGSGYAGRGRGRPKKVPEVTGGVHLKVPAHAKAITEEVRKGVKQLAKAQKSAGGEGLYLPGQSGYGFN